MFVLCGLLVLLASGISRDAIASTEDTTQTVEAAVDAADPDSAETSAEVPAEGPAEGPATDAEGGSVHETRKSRATELNRQLDVLLSESAPESDYRERSDCLYRRNYRHIDVLSDTYLLFSKGDDFWVNRLKQNCPMLSRHLMLSFVSHGQSACAGDSFYLSDRFDLDRGFDTSGRPAVIRGICVLGDFEKINEAQALALKEAVK